MAEIGENGDGGEHEPPMRSVACNLDGRNGHAGEDRADGQHLE
jgi:hypothetical protein